MANLKEVKTRINSVTSTQQITKAMKMVAAAKLRRAQDNILQMRPFAEKLNGILKNVSAGIEVGENAYSEERDEQKVLIVVVSSDRGLCGPFNSNAFKAAVNLIAEKYSAQEAAGNVTILPIGKKAYDFFNKRGYQLVDDYYLMFGSLSASSDLSDIVYEIEVLASNVIHATEAYADMLYPAPFERGEAL